MNAFLLPINDQSIDTFIPPPDTTMPMYRAAVAWLKTKYELKSHSHKTETAYREALQSFDVYLQGHGLHLDSNPREVALKAQEWVILSRAEGRVVSSSTINQRYAILSSFYLFAIKYGACEVNPIAYCERPQRQIQDDAPALDKDYVDACMHRIDRSTREGKRDHTFLMLALLTGRRSSELTGLQWKHISIQGDQMELKWKCKGAKVMKDTLDPQTARILLKFLQSEYGPDLEQITAESYIFQSHSRNNPGGRLSATTASQICLDRLGFSKVHVTRHSHAMNSIEAGATITEVGDQLGHANYKTTSDYLKKKSKNVHTYTAKLSDMFGIEE